MADKLNGVTITKVFKGKSGEGKYGPWQGYNFYIDDPDWKEQKFSYLQSGKKPVPEEGMKVDLEFETKQNGEYTNYDVKKLSAAGSGEKPKPKPAGKATSPGTGNGDNGKSAAGPGPTSTNGHDKNSCWWFCLSYAKDVVISRKEEPRITLEDAANLILQMADVFYTHTPGSTVKGAKPATHPTKEGKKPTFPEWVKKYTAQIPEKTINGMCQAYGVLELTDVTGEENQKALVADVTKVLKDLKEQRERAKEEDIPF